MSSHRWKRILRVRQVQERMQQSAVANEARAVAAARAEVERQQARLDAFVEDEHLQDPFMAQVSARFRAGIKEKVHQEQGVYAKAEEAHRAARAELMGAHRDRKAVERIHERAVERERQDAEAREAREAGFRSLVDHHRRGDS